MTMSTRGGEPGVEMVTLPNGRRAVRERATGEVMHPGDGPLAEAEGVYVGPSRLAERLAEGGDALVLYDVGLGAATNAVAAWKVSEAQPPSARRLEIVSFEHELDALALALDPANADALGLTRDGPDARAAAQALLDRGVHETARTTWRLLHGDLRAQLATLPANHADVVFWDLFSPRAAPALWSSAMFAAMRRACRDGATLHTYSTATSTRAAMLLGGFAVGVGAPTGARGETTMAATRVGDLARPLDARWLARLARSSAPFPVDVTDAADALARVRAMAQFAGASG